MKDLIFYLPNRNKKRIEENPNFPHKKPKTLQKSAFIELNTFDFPLLSPSTGLPIVLLRLEPDRPYTIGRDNASCDFTFGNRFVSKQHCQILYDSVDRKIFILDGAIFSDDFGFIVREFRRRFSLSDDKLEEKEKEVLGFSSVRVSLNGVYVNGVRVKRGMVGELFAGDEVLLVCGNENDCSLLVRVGFVIQGIVFKEEMVSELDEATGVRPWSLGTMLSSRNSQGTVSSGKRNKRVFAIPANEMTIGCDFSELKSGDLMGRAKFILSQCRSILHSDDPISCIRQFDNLASGHHRFLGLTVSNRMKFAIGSDEEVSSIFPLCRQEPQSSDKKDNPMQPSSFRKVATSEANDSLIGDLLPSDLPCGKGTVQGSGEDATAIDMPGMSLLNYAEKENAPDIEGVGTSKITTNSCSAPGKMFYLNRLAYLDCGSSTDPVISLQELLYPVESISQIFIATFTSDILWFVSHCEIPCHLPVTVACHNAERCWSSSSDARSSMPFPDYPNLVVVFPPFPDVIAFGNDPKKRGIACHHPKLLVLQRDDSIRIIITSANLVAKQWESVTNTIWWQDFPCRKEPDYLSLFSLSHGEMIQDSRSDFAAQLAGFMASLIVDVPSQAHWIIELTKYDFTSAMGHLVASLPGIHSDRALKGPSFLDMSKTMQAENIAALCSLIAAVQRCTGLWRLQEVLGRYKWPESEESDFVYGASSIGSSVSAQFLAAFAASVGKKSSQIFDSEESDPEWGCWTASQELRNPSIRIIFPTIEQVKNACNGISPSRRILCFAEVARRRFWSKTDSSSFGWVYCGSHNFSAAAWGRPISSSVGIKPSRLNETDSFMRLHICNYELGIIFVFPPMETKGIANQSSPKLDDIALPFVMPAPKYGPRDRPATAQAMREALTELSQRETKSLVEVENTENMMEEVPDEDEEVRESTNYIAEEKEEDKTYAEKLWSQADSS